jgi:hypothetical protein
MPGTRAARRGNTVVTEPQRQRIPIHGECHGLPGSASASPSSSVSAMRNAWLRHPGGANELPFYKWSSAVRSTCTPASAGWIQACLGSRSGLHADTTSELYCQYRKVKIAPCDHRGIRCSSLTCAFASGTGRAAAGSLDQTVSRFQQKPTRIGGPPVNAELRANITCKPGTGQPLDQYCIVSAVR